MRPFTKAKIDDRLKQDVLQQAITLCWIKNCRDTSPVPETLTLEKLVERFHEPVSRPANLPQKEFLALDKAVKEQKSRRNAEKDGKAFIPAEFAQANVRDEHYVVKVHAFVLDFDGGVGKAEIETKLINMGYLAYTTYSHHAGEDRWRVIIPYEVPCTPQQHAAVFEHFNALFEAKLDQRSKTLNQLWYAPACPPDAVDQYQLIVHVERLFNPYGVSRPAICKGQKLQNGTANIITPPQSAAIALVSHHGTSSVTPEQRDDLTNALQHINADERDVWVKVGMALKDGYGDAVLDIWLNWSKSSSKYEETDALYNWNSFKGKADGVTLGTVFYLARQGGWVPHSGTTAQMADIEELNADHFVSRENGKTCVFREKRDEDRGRQWLERMTTKDVADFYCNRSVTISSGSRTKTVGLGDYWLHHPNRRQYSEVVFRPNRETPGAYNLWRGFAFTPKQGIWSLMQYHIREVICAGIEELYLYVIGWLANAIQHPDRPGEVALVLQGGRGTGKGTFVHAIGRLFGQHYLQIAQSRHLVGNFNAHLRDCVMLFVDEALWAGDHQGENVLKALITEPTLQIEPKGVNAFSVPNCLHIIIASNSDWIIPAGERERRYCVLHVSEKHSQDTAYFAHLHAEMEAGGLAAMLYDLQNMDLSAFNVRKVPYTTGLKEQMLRTLPVERRWWYEELIKGEIWNLSSARGVIPHDQPPFSISRENLQQRFSEACHGLHASRGSATELGMLLPKLLPQGWPNEYRPTGTGSGKAGRYYVFPSLDVSRSHFEKITGIIGAFEGLGEAVNPPNLSNLSNHSGKLRKVNCG